MALGLAYNYALFGTNYSWYYLRSGVEAPLWEFSLLLSSLPSISPGDKTGNFFYYPPENKTKDFDIPYNCLGLGPWIACLLGHDEEEKGDGDEGVDENDEPVHERWGIETSRSCRRHTKPHLQLVQYASISFVTSSHVISDAKLFWVKCPFFLGQHLILATFCTTRALQIFWGNSPWNLEKMSQDCTLYL